jgi:uncharacterized protein YaiI (UPF0178 family)
LVDADSCPVKDEIVEIASKYQVEALDMRFLSAKERRRGNYGKGPKPYS